MPGPLAGIKVVDVSAVISGPMCRQILADQGADVLKVEPLGIGDLTRMGGYRVGTITAMYGAANRGKRSVALDLSQAAGVEAFKALIADADVVVQNFRPGAVERMGIGADDLHTVNPRLVYVSISGFGPTGPYAAWRPDHPGRRRSAVDPDEPGDPDPRPRAHAGLRQGDGLHRGPGDHRRAVRPGDGQRRGQHLEIPMLDSALYFLWPDVFMRHSQDLGRSHRSARRTGTADRRGVARRRRRCPSRSP